MPLAKNEHVCQRNLKEDDITYHEIKEDTKNGIAIFETIKEQALIKLGYFLKPSELFSEIAKRGNRSVGGEKGDVKINFILGDFAKILPNIERRQWALNSKMISIVS